MLRDRLTRYTPDFIAVQRSLGAPAAVLKGLAINKPLEGWVALNRVLLAQAGLLGGVHLHRSVGCVLAG